MMGLHQDKKTRWDEWMECPDCHWHAPVTSTWSISSSVGYASGDSGCGRSVACCPDCGEQGVVSIIARNKITGVNTHVKKAAWFDRLLGIGDSQYTTDIMEWEKK